MPPRVAKKRSDVTMVHEHSRKTPVSSKNPSGVTIVDQHLRHLPGTFLNSDEILKISKNYVRKGLTFPSSGKLPEYPNADIYDDTIAIWTDYFNKKFQSNPPLDPDVVKALLGSESGFETDPKGNKIALGIAQITKPTLKILQDPNGEVKEFIFNKFKQKDLKNPDIAIPMAIRWLFKKKDLATNKLKRDPTHEEIILEYKGLLKSKSTWKKNALSDYKEKYDKLKSK